LKFFIVVYAVWGRKAKRRSSITANPPVSLFIIR
jgi:hypothetical protein